MSELKASKYQAYPEYRKVASEWLSKIPQSWTISTLKHVARINMGQSPSSEDCNIEGIGIPFLQGNAEFGIKTPLEKQYCPIPRKIAQKGELLFSVRAPVGALNFASKSFGIGRGLCSIRGNDSVSQSFLWWLLPSYKYQFDAIATGSTFEAISAEQVGNLSFALPNNEEQTQIANFLDHETAKIDTLIEKQQQLINLLKEKRQAVISHAVTKGLNPQALMKDSGVEWLGEVPKHWDVCKLSYRYEVLLGKMLDERKVTGNYLGKYLRNTDVQWDSINTEDLPSMDFRPHEADRYSVRKGDLIVCEGGDIGRCAIWENEGTCFYQKALHRLRPVSKDDLTRFMFYVMFDAVYQERFISGAGKATIAHLPAVAFKQYRFAFPPKNEQQSIIKHLDTLKEKFDLMERKANNQIDLLRERRTALISAAVTGKIDVRNWEQPND